MSKLRAVLFDRDETIAYTDRTVYREAAQWLGQQHGLEPRFAGETLAAVWDDLGQTWWDLRTDADEQRYWNDYGAELTRRLGIEGHHAGAIIEHFPYERYMKPVAQAREVLGELRARGLKIGVLSNTLPSIDRTLQEIGLADLVDVALATCTLGVHKPEAQAFLLSAQALGVRPDEVLFVDDKIENVEAARAVGMQATVIDLSGQNHDAIHDLREVLQLVNETD